MANFKLDVDADGIALVTWDMPGKSMNVIDFRVMDELDAVGRQGRRRCRDQGRGDHVRQGHVRRRRRPHHAGEAARRLCGDAARPRARKPPTAWCSSAAPGCRRSIRKLETCGKPWVAALNGTAMGGCFELALACHHRIAADNPKTRLGLPEIKVGLFPGAGGTQRIPRMMATADALQFLLKGDQIRLDRAKTMKLVDAIVPAADLVKAAKDWIKTGGKSKQPWDVDGFKLPGGPVWSKMGMMTFPAANALYRKETQDNYPAARAIMSCVFEGLQVPFDTALRIESRYFAKVVRSPEAAAMIRSLFVSMQELNKGARRPERSRPRPEEDRRARRRLHGRRHRLCDGAGRARRGADRPRSGAPTRARRYSASCSGETCKKGRAKQADADALLRAITPTPDYRRLKGVDLVIEACSRSAR
jgi:3-hydroxyacyl-CoA dehydrogenase/enoyl-CoA hydratase/3-hydroxybutyryl-CoA epimerase